MINQSQINEFNNYLQLKIKKWEIEYENLSCKDFIKINGFYKKEISDIELKYPMAFSIFIYKNLYQFQVLIRTLYSRTNFHCIHIDAKASLNIYNYALKLSKCLDNIYLCEIRNNLSWGTMSILQIERICQIMLLRKSSKWFYYMTIAGSELPIQTNRNRIEILEIIPDKTRNDISSMPQYKNRQLSKQNIYPPNNITIYKGEFHSILTRDFIQSIHNNSISNQLWSYLNGTSVPDEHFYPTLVHLSELPGGKQRGTLIYPYYELLSHYKNWKNQPYNECQSNIFIEGVCQFNYKDLIFIEQSRKLFANKFNQDLDLISIYCWEQWINIKQIHYLNINKNDYLDKFPFTQTNQTQYSHISKEYYEMIKYLSQ